MSKYVSINGVRMGVSNIVITEVKVCRGVRYSSVGEKFVEVMGWGFEIISGTTHAYSVVQASRFLAQASREGLIEDIKLAKHNDKLFC